MKRTILIGDLHGCHDEAVELLDRVAASTVDRVVFLGDLVDRGPKPRECVELAMKYECILGNHEEKHLRQRRRPDSHLTPEHLRTRRALGDEHWVWLEKLPAFLLLPEHGAAAVHAGALPGIAIAAQDPYHLLHAQCVRPPERKSYWPAKAPSTHTFWTNHWRGPERVVFGHTVVDRPLVSEHALGIDTGCVFGGSLTAAIFGGPNAVEIVSVASRQPRSGRMASRRSERVTRIRIHGEVSAYS